MEPIGSLSGSPFYHFNNLPSGEFVFKFIIEGEKAVLLHKMTVVNESLTKSLLSLEPSRGSSLPFGSNPSSLAVLLRLSLICPQMTSQAAPLTACPSHTGCSGENKLLSVSSLPGCTHLSFCLESSSHHPSTTLSPSVQCLFHFQISAAMLLPPGNLPWYCPHIWIRRSLSQVLP